MVVGVFAGGPEYKMLGDHDLNLIIFEILLMEEILHQLIW